MLCDGRAISRTTYAELFAKLGTTFGAGDGSTTFNLPDFRDKTMWGANGNLNSTKSSGLPNLYGEINIPNGNRVSGSNYYAANGIFSFKSNATNGGNADGAGFGGRIKVDASTYNAIYGASEIVQPPAICVNVFICVSQVPIENSGS